MDTISRLKVRKAAWNSLLAALVLSLAATSVALAASGDLDTTFSGDGLITTNFSGPYGDGGHGVAVQSDGKIVVVGTHLKDGAGTSADFALLRYNANGSLDKTFNNDGKAATNFGDFDEAGDVALQTDGKIVVAGNTTPSTEIAYDLAVSRYNSDGSLDNTFSDDGKFTAGFGGNNGGFGGLVVLSSGKIVVGGYMTNGNNEDFAVYRLTANGGMDNTFSVDGKVNIGFGAERDERAFDLVVQPDGKIVVVGYSCDQTQTCNFAVARLNSNGTFDTTFSGDGKQMTDLGGNDIGYALALQSNGKIVVAGTRRISSDSNFALVRYNSNGSLDVTFGGGDGKVFTNMGGIDEIRSLAIQADGKIVGAGRIGQNWAFDFGVARYNSNGALDTTFSGDGKAFADFGGSDSAFAMALQSNGRIVVAGGHNDGADDDFAVARFLP